MAKKHNWVTVIMENKLRKAAGSLTPGSQSMPQLLYQCPSIWHKLFRLPLPGWFSSAACAHYRNRPRRVTPVPPIPAAVLAAPKQEVNTHSNNAAMVSTIPFII